MKALLDLVVEVLFVPLNFVIGLLELAAPAKPIQPPDAQPGPQPSPEPTAPTEMPAQAPKPTGLLWDTPQKAWHSVRVICDEVGLSFNQKNILCACVYQESEFLTHPKPNQNRDPHTGRVWSTDYGIAQVNDYWHIGPGKDFPTVEYVLDNPEKVMRWMAYIMYKTGKLQPWSSYATGAYVKWLDPRSKMWALAQ